MVLQALSLAIDHVAAIDLTRLETVAQPHRLIKIRDDEPTKRVALSEMVKVVYTATCQPQTALASVSLQANEGFLERALVHPQRY